MREKKMKERVKHSTEHTVEKDISIAEALELQQSLQTDNLRLKQTLKNKDKKIQEQTVQL